MIYISHRGKGIYGTIGNTLDSFAGMYKFGKVRCFELDVHLLKDGSLAVHHDYSLLKTTGKDVKLADLTAQDLKKYPYPRRSEFDKLEPIYVPLLTDVLSIFSSGLELLDIELKNDNNVYPGIEEILLKTLRDYPQFNSKILFSSFDYETLKRLRTLAPNARIGLLTRNFDIEQAVALGAESVHLNWTRFTPEMAVVCHAKNIQVYVYTVNDVSTAQRLERQGVDGIFTDRIELFV